MKKLKEFILLSTAALAILLLVSWYFNRLAWFSTIAFWYSIFGAIGSLWIAILEWNNKEKTLPMSQIVIGVGIIVPMVIMMQFYKAYTNIEIWIPIFIGVVLVISGLLGIKNKVKSNKVHKN